MGGNEVSVNYKYKNVTTRARIVIADSVRGAQTPKENREVQVVFSIQWLRSPLNQMYIFIHPSFVRNQK
jgi:hypothetical protein